MALPCVLGSDWTIARPYVNKRYSWVSEGWSFTVRDVGCSWLYRVHARTPDGATLTYHRDVHTNPSGDGHDGLSPLFGAAHRLVAGRSRSSDVWKSDELASIYLEDTHEA